MLRYDYLKMSILASLSSLLFMWHHKQSLKAIGVLGYPITNFMKNGQAQYNWLNDFDYLVAISNRCIMEIANSHKLLL